MGEFTWYNIGLVQYWRGFDSTVQQNKPVKHWFEGMGEFIWYNIGLVQYWHGFDSTVQQNKNLSAFSADSLLAFIQPPVCSHMYQHQHAHEHINPFTVPTCKIFGLKSAPYTPKDSIFDGPITNLHSLLCILIEVLSHADAKGAQRLHNFECGTFIGRFPSDHVASLAVKGLNCKCMCQSLTSAFKELCGCTVLCMPIRENNQADTLVGRATTTNGLCLRRSEVLRSLRHYLQARIQGHLTNDFLEERGWGRGHALWSSFSKTR